MDMQGDGSWKGSEESPFALSMKGTSPACIGSTITKGQ